MGGGEGAFDDCPDDHEPNDVERLGVLRLECHRSTSPPSPPPVALLAARCLPVLASLLTDELTPGFPVGVPTRRKGPPSGQDGRSASSALRGSRRRWNRRIRAFKRNAAPLRLDNHERQEFVHPFPFVVAENLRRFAAE